MPSSPPSHDVSLAALRREYSQRALSEAAVDRDPTRQFLAWMRDVIAAEAFEPNAMTLATAAPDGQPSARVVLLKGVDNEGFAFYTNYASRKARELEGNPRAALVFWWPELERQVRVEGQVRRTSEAESDAYFASRPPASRVGSAASPQSQVIESRDVLVAREAELLRQFPAGDVPRPPHWGGYRLKPSRIEFWQGRPSRLHDRIEYVREGSAWKIRRLAP